MSCSASAHGKAPVPWLAGLRGTRKSRVPRTHRSRRLRRGLIFDDIDLDDLAVGRLLGRELLRVVPTELLGTDAGIVAGLLVLDGAGDPPQAGEDARGGDEGDRDPDLAGQGSHRAAIGPRTPHLERR